MLKQEATQRATKDGTGATKARRCRRAITTIAAALALMFGAATNATIAVAQQSPAPTAAAPTARSNANIVSDGLNSSGGLRLTVNKSAVLTTKVPYKTASIGNPAIADINLIGPGNVLVTAKAAGTTQLIIWDQSEHSQVVDITVEVDLDGLQGQLKAMFPNTTIEVAQLNGAIALKGRVPSIEVATQATAVASPYSQKVLNLLEVSGGQQVQLLVRFAEVSRTASSALGVNGNFASGAFVGGSNIGQVNPSSRMPSQGLVGDTPPPQGINLDGATPVGAGVTLYGAGQIGNFYLEYFIQALRNNNLLRILAEPNLIAISGQEAKFLAGGEFPVPVTQGGATAGAVTVEYRKFGVMLKFVPVVMGDGRIRLKVAPEVSDLDFTTAVRFSGFTVPGLTSRQVETTIELADGQTFAIAGLLNNSVTASKDVTPLLGDLPIVGALFRSVRYQRKETELVVLVTPRLVEPMNPSQVPALPGEQWRHPTENELFWNRDLGSDMSDTRHGPRMHAKGETAPGAATTQAAADASSSSPAMPSSTASGFAPRTNDASKQNVSVDEQESAGAQARSAEKFRGTWGFTPASQPTEESTADIGGQ